MAITSLSDAKYLADPELIGNKGVGIKFMAKLGIPTPPGFILTTNVWREYNEKGSLSDSLKKLLRKSIEHLEASLHQSFTSQNFHKPLIFSVRSSSKYSMPGMMDTILNVGINPEKLDKFGNSELDQIFAYDTYRRFIKMFASSVYSIHPGEFDILDEVVSKSGKFNLQQNKLLVSQYHKMILAKSGKKIPFDPNIQIEQALIAVLNSCYNPGAVAFRQINGIPEDLGTAVIIQVMVFGNKPGSCTGVLFTRNTETGTSEITGDFLENAQGEDIVRGATSRKTLTRNSFQEKFPDEAAKVFKFARKLESLKKDVQDIEFTIDRGRIWFLQTRIAKRTSLANVRFASSLYQEGLISENEALSRIKPGDIQNLSNPVFDVQAEALAKEKNFLAKGDPASVGVATGLLALSTKEVNNLFQKHKKPIYICDHIDPNDLDTLVKSAAVITTRGSSSSHMAIIMRSLGLAGIVGCKDIILEKNNIRTRMGVLENGTAISVNATIGEIYRGRLPITMKKDIPADLKEIIANRIKMFGGSAWTAAFYQDKSAPNYQILRRKVSKFSSELNSKWKSQKARVIEILNRVFSEKLMISSKVIKPEDGISLRAALLDVIESGNYNAPRTCHFPVKLLGAPWADGPNTPEEVKKFLKNPNYPGKYGGLKKWIQDPTLDAVIVSKEPKDKLNPKFTKDHFVCTVTCINTNPAMVDININLGAVHLRSLERIEPVNLIVVRAALDAKFAFGLGEKTYQFGAELFSSQKIKKVIKRLQSNIPLYKMNNLWERKYRHLAKQIFNIFPELDVNEVGIKEFKEILVELVNHHALTREFHELVLDNSRVKLLDNISQIILDEWWRPPYSLPYTMAALDEILGISVLEIQGRVTGKNREIKWL
ncbi:MAG TPA: PEP/pyruvate-binding domain-containing protein, partial [Candidatus Dojkabacteria bacterium]|nr:PEP/pyruvate-binding domain-containing protein [Candidatus Dojkabacteria bacterium]